MMLIQISDQQMKMTLKCAGLDKFTLLTMYWNEVGPRLNDVNV